MCTGNFGLSHNDILFIKGKHELCRPVVCISTAVFEVQYENTLVDE